MRQILYAAGAVALAAVSAGCTAYDRSYAYAPPGAVYYGDRTNPSGSSYYYYPSQAYAYPSNAYPSTTGYYYSNGDYYRNYRGIHSADERTM